MQIEAVGSQWIWNFRLPGIDNQLGTSDVRMIDSTNSLGINPGDPRGSDDLIVSDGELHLPVNKPVKVLLRSVDVLHDFYIPQVRAKMDLVPGLVSYLWFTPTVIGEYEILCAAYCGNGHPQMRGKLIVDSESDFAIWLNKQTTFAQSRKAQVETRRIWVN
jgi:cytochrome c oxidase subunit 2